MMNSRVQGSPASHAVRQSNPSTMSGANAQPPRTGLYRPSPQMLSTLHVSGVDTSMDIELLQLYFESPRKSQGGTIVNVSDHRQQGYILLTFEDPSVADRVLGRPHKIGQRSLSVTRPLRQASPGSDQHASDESADLARKIEVRGSEAVLDPDLLEMYFESKRSGGGPVEKVEVTEVAEMAVITFVDAKTAADVLKRSHKVGGTVLTVTPYKPPGKSATVRVSGLKPSASEDLLQLYFESERGGGAEVKDIQLDSAKGEALVTFVDSAAATEVLKRSHKVGSTILTVTQYQPPRPSATIKVSGLKHNVSVELIQLYFESERGGGADVKDIKLDAERGEAFITFVDPAIVQDILQRNHTISKSKVTVSLSTATPSKSTPPSHDSAATPPPDPCTVEVRGLSAKTTQETLQFFFENKRRSGGGPTKDIQLDPVSGVTVITFEDADDARRVLERQRFKLDGKDITVTLPTPSPKPTPARAAASASLESSRGKTSAARNITVAVPTPSAPSSARHSRPSAELSSGLNAVAVRGLALPVSEDTLCNYFENKRRSGGGPVAGVTTDAKQGVVFVTFENANDAASVVSRKQTLEGQTLTVQLHKPPKMMGDHILIMGLPAINSSDELQDLVEAKTGEDVKRILLGKEEGTAAVIFQQVINFEQVHKALTRRPFMGQKLNIQQVPVTTTVLVRGFSQDRPVSEDALQMYFENARRSGGGETSDVEMAGDGSYATVTFLEPDVAARVASREHVINGRHADVTLYMECLGPSGGSDEPTPQAPGPVPIPDADQKKISLLKEIPGCLDALQSSLEESHAVLAFDTPDRARLCCSLSPEKAGGRQLLGAWPEKATNVLQKFLQCICVEEVQATAEEFRAAEKPLREMATDNAVGIRYNEQMGTIYIIYDKVEKPLVATMRQTTEKVQSSLNKRKMYRKEVIAVGKGKLSMIKGHNIWQVIRGQFPDLTADVNVEDGVVELTGANDEIRDAKEKLLEVLSSIVSVQQTWDVDLAAQLLQDPNARSTVFAKCLEQDPEGQLELIADGVEIMSFDGRRAEAIQVAFRNAVQKRVIRFSEENTEARTLPAWAELKASLLQRNKGLMLLQEDKDCLTMVSVSTTLREDHQQLKTFLLENNMQERAFDLEKPLHGLLKLYLREKQLGLKVTIDNVIFDEDKARIRVKGNKPCVDAAEKMYYMFSRSIVHISKTYTQPSMAAFLQSRSWTATRMDIEHRLQCKILEPTPVLEKFLGKVNTNVHDVAGGLSSPDNSAIFGLGSALAALQAQTQKQPASVGARLTVNKDGKPGEVGRATREHLFFEQTRGQVSLLFLGLDKRRVEEAEAELMACYTRRVVTVSHTVAQFHTWSDLNVSTLVHACMAAVVDVTLNFSLGRLQLRGFQENVDRVPIHPILREAEAEAHQQQNAHVLQQQVEWKYIVADAHGEHTVSYDALSNYKIEMAYRNNDANVVLLEPDNAAYIVNFTAMERRPEIPGDKEVVPAPVIRHDKIKGAALDAPLPDRWSDMKGQDLEVVPLQTSGAEYTKVATIFNNSVRQPNVKILRIQRVQNATLYKQYMALYHMMQKSFPEGRLFEKDRMWHGTRGEVADGIIRYGFNRSYSDKARSAYGQGAYFATSAEYSSRNSYAVANLAGERHMFMCRVLVGEYTVGDQNTRLPPEIPNAAGKRYNSTVDDVAKPSIFVTYSDVQAYPEYFIVFKDG